VADEAEDPAAARARHLERMSLINNAFFAQAPHSKALGMEIVEMGDGMAICRLPYAAQLVGNPETGVLHGGVITTLMDAVCGTAVFMRLDQPVPIATLDLRVDFLEPTTPLRDVFACARCFRVTSNVAFVRGVAYHDDEDHPIASATGAFMLGTSPAGRTAGPR
jgi:uncharacterized protein (TIGR00369 family)